MFDSIFRPKDEKLQEAINSVYSDLAGFTAETEEHQKALAQLTELYALRPNAVVDPNKLVEVFGQLTVAMVVLKYEQTGVITTRLFQFFGKMR